jgi:hypothetical protein
LLFMVAQICLNEASGDSAQHVEKVLGLEG